MGKVQILRGSSVWLQEKVYAYMSLCSDFQNMAHIYICFDSFFPIRTCTIAKLVYLEFPSMSMLSHLHIDWCYFLIFFHPDCPTFLHLSSQWRLKKTKEFCSLLPTLVNSQSLGGAVAAWAQEGLEELSRVEGEEGRRWGDTPRPR